MVVGVLLLTSLFAEGDAQEKDQKASADVTPQGGWGGGGPGGGGWGGGGSGGGGGWGGGGGGWGGGGGGWGGGGCKYKCGYRCCKPEEIAKFLKDAEMKTDGKMTMDGKPVTVVGTERYGGGGGYGGGDGGYGGGCRHYCGRRCCSPEEIANLENHAETTVGTQGYGGGGWGGGGGRGGGGGGGWGGGGGGWGGGGGCRYRCGGRCCTPEEIANLKNHAETVVGTQGYGGGGWGGGGGRGGGGWGGGGGCRHYCGGRCCTAEEIANNPELYRSETKNAESKMDPDPVKKGEVKN